MARLPITTLFIWERFQIYVTSSGKDTKLFLYMWGGKILWQTLKGQLINELKGGGEDSDALLGGEESRLWNQEFRFLRNSQCFPQIFHLDLGKMKLF
ncbi:MAG: hypothetical protein K2M88_02760 [Muribaculaceae bacterium]|nr:hypothetical protein [Muribaculaceae bacterium]